MEFLPNEVIEYVAVNLTLRDAKSLSRVSRQGYHGSLKRIWSYPTFRKRYLAGKWRKDLKFKLPTVAVKDISHLPIRRLYSSDLRDFEKCQVQELPFTLKEIFVDVPLTSDTSILRFKNSSIKVNIFWDALKTSRLVQGPQLCRFLESMDNVMILTGSRYCCCDAEGLDYDDLEDFHRIPFSVFSTNHLRDIWDFEKFLLMDVLKSMKIQEFQMVPLKFSCRGLEFSKHDLMTHLKDMNIVRISNSILEDDLTMFGFDQPWSEFHHFKSLEVMHFVPGTSINLWNLKKFNFIAVKLGSENAKTPVNDIVTLRKMFENCSMYSRIARIGPTWTFVVYLEVIIYLQTSIKSKKPFDDEVVYHYI